MGGKGVGRETQRRWGNMAWAIVPVKFHCPVYGTSFASIILPGVGTTVYQWVTGRGMGVRE